MRKRIILVSVLVLLMLASCIGLSLSSNSSPNSLGAPAAVTRSFTLSGEGTSVNYIGSLASLADRDTYNMTLPYKVKITVIVADCCIMGDTIGIFAPINTLKTSAKSPNTIVGSAVMNPGTYQFYVGYVACPGGFSAGYYIWIIATHA